MKAVILAGGKGTRLQSVIPDLPKPLAPTQGKPFLRIVLDFLYREGITEAWVSVGHMADKFHTLLPILEQSGVSTHLVMESNPLGTGGAVRFVCKDWNDEERILILNGDTFFNFDLRKFISIHTTNTALALRAVPTASRYGSVQVANDLVINFREKEAAEKPGLIYAGFALARVGDIKRILPDGPSSLEHDFFPTLLKRGEKISGQEFEGQFIDIGIPQDYELANTSFNFGLD